MPKGFNFSGGPGYDLSALASGYQSTVSAEQEGARLKHAALASLAEQLERAQERQARAQENAADRQAATENVDRQAHYNRLLQRASQEFQSGEGALDRGFRAGEGALDRGARVESEGLETRRAIELGYLDNQRALALEDKQQAGAYERAGLAERAKFETEQLEQRKKSQQSYSEMMAFTEAMAGKGNVQRDVSMSAYDAAAAIGLDLDAALTARNKGDPDGLKTDQKLAGTKFKPKDLPIDLTEFGRMQQSLSSTYGPEATQKALEKAYPNLGGSPSSTDEVANAILEQAFGGDFKSILGLSEQQGTLEKTLERMAEFMGAGRAGAAPSSAGLPRPSGFQGSADTIPPGASPGKTTGPATPPSGGGAPLPVRSTGQSVPQPTEAVPLTESVFNDRSLNLEMLPPNIRSGIRGGQFKVYLDGDGNLHAIGPGGEGDLGSRALLRAIQSQPQMLDIIKRYASSPHIDLNLDQTLKYVPPVQGGEPPPGVNPSGFSSDAERYLYGKVKRP